MEKGRARGSMCERERDMRGWGASDGSAIKSAHTGKNLGAFKAE